MEEHVELALSRWAKEYNKEWERREKERNSQANLVAGIIGREKE